MDNNVLNLLPAIRELEKSIKEKELEFEFQISLYRRSLRELRELNQACECCDGQGKKLRSRACAEDDRPDPNDPSDYIICPACHGTGRKKTGCD